jgi:hypothetical protein
MGKIKGWKKQIADLSSDFYNDEDDIEVWNSELMAYGNPKVQITVEKNDFKNRWVLTVYDVNKTKIITQSYHFIKTAAMKSAIKYMRSHPNG